MIREAPIKICQLGNDINTVLVCDRLRNLTVWRLLFNFFKIKMSVMTFMLVVKRLIDHNKEMILRDNKFDFETQLFEWK